MAVYLNGGVFQAFLEGKADFASAGYIKAYSAGTDIEVDTYPTVEDAVNKTNPNTWPCPLDMNGKVVVALSGATDVYIYDANGNQLDSVLGLDSSSSDITGPDGSILIHYIFNEGASVGISFENASTGQAAVISAYGNNTNSALNVTSKGNSPLELNGGATGAVDIANNSTGNINLHRNTFVTGDINTTGNANISGNLTVTGTSALTGNTTITGSLTINGAINILPAGSIIAYGGTTAPTGWAECNGGTQSRTAQAALFANIGIAFGSGDGSTTFNIPNFNRRVPVGRNGTGTGTLGNAVGNSGGSETITLTSGNMPTNIPFASSAFSTQAVQSGGSTNVPGGAGTWGAGSATAVNILQPSLVVMYIIKLV